MGHPNRVVSLGNISGTVEVDLAQGDYFIGLLVGNCSFAFINGPSNSFIQLDLEQDEDGGHTIDFEGAGGLPIVDPGLIKQTIAATPGDRSIGLWGSGGTFITALGYNTNPVS